MSKRNHSEIENTETEPKKRKLTQKDFDVKLEKSLEDVDKRLRNYLEQTNISLFLITINNTYISIIGTEDLTSVIEEFNSVLMDIKPLKGKKMIKQKENKTEFKNFSYIDINEERYEKEKEITHEIMSFIANSYISKTNYLFGVILDDKELNINGSMEMLAFFEKIQAEFKKKYEKNQKELLKSI